MRSPESHPRAFLARRTAALAAVLALTATLAAYGASAQRPAMRSQGDRAGFLHARAGAGRRRACPGAQQCPYQAVTTIGHRGEGVLRYPEALALGSDGQVWVADQFSSVVEHFSADGRFLGQWGQHGHLPGEFDAVGGLALSEDGRDLYLVDATHDRVEEFDLSGRLVRWWGGHGKAPGRFDFGGGAPGVPPGGGIALGGGHVYVSDTANDRVERFSLDGGGATVWRGNLSSPHGLAFHDGHLYVTDTGAGRVLELTSRGGILRSAGSPGEGDGQFESPWDLAVSPTGEVLVADDNNHRIVRLDRTLGVERIWAVQSSQSPSEGMRPNFGSVQVAYPRAIAVSGAGDVYVADAAASQILEYGPSGEPLRSWGRSALSYGEFVQPRDVAATPAGGVAVADTLGRRIETFDSRRAFAASLDGGAEILGTHLFKPVALALAPGGTLWVADQENGLVRHLSGSGHLLGTLEVPGSGGRPPEADAVAVGPRGELYVADAASGEILRYSPSGTLLGLWDGARAAAGRAGPLALAVARSGEVYLAESAEDRIERFSAEGRLLAAWGRRGSGAGEMREPDGIALDASGEVFVSDRGNDRIEEFGERGSLLREWGALGGAPGELDGPAGLSLECNGSLLVADTYNNRVESFAGVAAPARCTSAGAR